MLRTTFVALLACGICKAGYAQDLSTTTVQDVYLRDPGRVNYQPPADRIVPISSSLSDVVGPRMGQALPIERLSLQAHTLLTGASDGAIAASGDDSEGYYSLVIEGQNYILDTIEAIYDTVFDAHHVLAAIVNAGPEAYARISIDSESGAIAGTVDTGARRYRLLSGEDLSEQTVFLLDSRFGERDELISSAISLHPGVVRIERRHLQAERIAEIKPSIFSHGRNGFSTNINGGDIGTMNTDEIDDPEAIARLLKDLSVFTRATGDEELEIVSVTRAIGEVKRVKFRQLIGGVPVLDESQLDIGPEGDIKAVRVRVLDPSVAPEINVSEEETLSIATDHLEREFGHLGILETSWYTAELQYWASAASQTEYGAILAPQWRLPVSIETTRGHVSASVVINANTAETYIRQSRMNPA